MGGQNLCELAFETVKLWQNKKGRIFFKLIASLILDIKGKKNLTGNYNMFSCLHQKLLAYWSLRNSGFKQETSGFLSRFLKVWTFKVHTSFTKYIWDWLDFTFYWKTADAQQRKVFWSRKESQFLSCHI